MNKKKALLLIVILLIAITIIIIKKDKNKVKVIKNYKHFSNKIVKKEELYTFEKAIKQDKSYKINKDYQKDPKEYSYKDIFKKDRINNTKINMNNNNYIYLIQNSIRKPEVLVNSIEINNYKIKYPSIKTKGDFTLSNVWLSDKNRFSYTVDFKEYINKKNNYKENQNLLGLNKISFNNMFGDPTLLKEYLSYYLLTEIGVDTEEFAYTNLYINNKYKGIYFMLEPIDSSLEKRTLNDDSDFFIKPGVFGGNLVYDKKLDKYINKDGNFDFSKILYDKKGNIKYPKNNILYKYRGLWDNDQDNFEEIVDYLPNFFKWLKQINELNEMTNKNTKEYEEKLEKLIDVDKLIRYWAANIYLVNSDSYMSSTIKNYALHMTKDGFVTIFPWDYNFSFGGAYLNTTEDIVNHDIYNPTIHTTLKERPLINLILGNDNYKEKYSNYLEDILIIISGGTTSDNKYYQEDNFIKIIDQYKEDIINNQKKDKDSFYNEKEINTAQTNLKELIKLRNKSVYNQLNGNKERIETDIEINTLGGLKEILDKKAKEKVR